jgi:hypothetical protein
MRFNSALRRFLIQETNLGTWILPSHYGLLAESQLKRCELLRAWVADDPAQAGRALYQPEEILTLSGLRWRLTFLLFAAA